MAILAPGRLTAALVGAVAGALAGLVPGLHPNTLAAATLALDARWTLPGLPATAFLLAAMAAWTFTTAVPLVVLGVPEGESAPALMPGQRLARAGHADLALSASASGSLTGLIVGVPAALTVVEGLSYAGGNELVGTLTPWVAAGGLLVLVLTDPAGPLRAGLVALLAGALGWLALSTPVRSPLGWPSTPLMPLFVGLYGLPALRHAAGSKPPDESPPTPSGQRPPRGPGVQGPLVGAGLGLLAGTFSGFTAGPATAVAAQTGSNRETGLMATMSAVNTASVCVATGVLHAVQRTRTGVHAARLALAWPTPGWDAVVGDLAAVGAGAVVGLTGLAIARRHADTLAERVPDLAGLLVVPWIAGIVCFTGWPGALVGLAAWTMARAAHGLGTRRSLLMACLLVPALIRALGA